MAKYTASQIADWIILRYTPDAGDAITPLKLQKLLYYCQAWHYTVYDEPLFDDKIEAWARGPVIPSQFERFSYLEIGDNILNNWPEFAPDIVLEKYTENLLYEVMSVYGQHTAYYLERLVQSEKPWKETRGDLEFPLACDKEIPLPLMKAYYSSISKTKNGKNKKDKTAEQVRTRRLERVF
ncbi:putative phage-associated protein [Bacteroidales bacterium Barb4]|nr:putative phage-associated protein [Bacteroidales bacterium Barb4]